MDTDLDILTPEKTVITYRLAGIGARFGAQLVDIAAIIGICFGWSLLIGFLTPTFGPLAGGVGIVGIGAIPFLYFILLEGLWSGRTFGKAAFSLRVLRMDGTPVTLFAATVRNLMRPADILPPPTALVGLGAMFLNPRLQRLGDLVAGTVVALEPKTLPAVTIAPHQVGVHALEHRIGDLRRMSEPEYWALRRYCDRFPFLPEPIGARLTERLWIPLAGRLGIELPGDVHPIFLAEATVMKFGRERGLL